MGCRGGGAGRDQETPQPVQLLRYTVWLETQTPQPLSGKPEGRCSASLTCVRVCVCVCVRAERASQTFNNPLRERPTITEPPPSMGFNLQVRVRL